MPVMLAMYTTPAMPIQKTTLAMLVQCIYRRHGVHDVPSVHDVLEDIAERNPPDTIYP